MAKLEAFPMTGGSGRYRYTRNSTLQRKVIESTKELIKKAIFEELEITSFSSSNTFRVADLGCSVGPNTFLAVPNILDAVKLKYENKGLVSQLPEFQVLFNDHVSNDFNRLFTSLPSERAYFAVGVPGSFHGRLFPRSSLHFVYSSYALHWISRVPKEDIGRFLNARAQEIVHGGLMAIVVPACPSGTPHADVFINKAIELLGCCLIDMVRMGVTSEDKVDTFNLST
ncbi:loganic acid O-methyltransferase-like [Ziziphus jujuba]|uniref:Loganic acid O-methyltransferase-like n=1 Tax=Ziziphus jujuba TaxID=326968 RepID=A0ABM4A2N6_ZIZJJ|nr:loganic acid O-methyltransferase-like [Ziziphus jujuba]